MKWLEEEQKSEFKRKDVINALDNDFSRANLDRGLNLLKEQGKLEKIKAGLYQIKVGIK